ncbi:MAG: hypothetical protein PHU85_15685 [Phycisphaerae bacterium]|nr:hypothetical protein [Phycisphaerae bacterium]
MSEHIDNLDLLGSGGHVWLWDDRVREQKVVGSAGIVGAYSMITSLGERAGRIAGKNGARAVLKATGASKAVADAALNVIEAAIEAYCDLGTEVEWEDDQAHTGTALVLVSYRRIGGRLYGASGASVAVWQFYELILRENNGSWD